MNRSAGTSITCFFSTVDSPNCFLLDFKEVGGRPTSTMEAKLEAMPYHKTCSITMLVQGFTRFEIRNKNPKLIVHFAKANPVVIVRQSKSLED